MPHALDDQIATVLRTPAGTGEDPAFGFDALEPDGRTKADLSEQVLAAMAREALTRSIPGVTFNSIVAHRDECGQLMAVEIDYMDEVHDPSSRTTKVVFDGEAG